MGDELRRVRTRGKKLEKSTNNCITAFMVPKYTIPENKRSKKKKNRKKKCKKICRRESVFTSILPQRKINSAKLYLNIQKHTHRHIP